MKHKKKLHELTEKDKRKLRISDVTGIFMCVDKLPQNNQKVIIEVDGKRQKAKFTLGKFNVGIGQFRDPITQIKWWEAR